MLTALLLLLASTPSAHALTPHETFFFQGTPSPDQIAQWTALPGARSFLIQAGDPFAEELKPLALLRGADRIQVEVSRFPSDDTIPTWSQLAFQGVELVTLGAGYPTDDEVRRLKAASFSGLTLITTAYPGPADAARLGRIRGKMSLTFAVRAYPKFEDKEGLLALPATLPLAFATDYWPFYAHMDVLNMLPQPRKIRVAGMLPPEDSLPYLHNIKLLDSVTLETESEPPAEVWRKLDGLNLIWSCKGFVPTLESLKAFATTATQSRRKLIVDQDLPLSADELERLTLSPLNVEWIHEAR